jgi:hypothetical protein
MGLCPVHRKASERLAQVSETGRHDCPAGIHRSKYLTFWGMKSRGRLNKETSPRPFLLYFVLSLYCQKNTSHLHTLLETFPTPPNNSDQHISRLQMSFWELWQ